MKSKLILALLLAIQLLLPAAAGEKRHFLAVYTMPGEIEHPQWLLWAKFKPDLYFESSNFGDFPVFLELVKQQAGERQIDLDIDCHGEDLGLALFRRENSDDTTASVGYVCNEIDKHMDPRKVTVLLESCYAGRALHYTLENNFLPGKYYQDHKGEIRYPVYAIGGATPNYGNLIFLQWRSGNKVFFEDIRKYENTQLPQKVEGENFHVFAIWLLFVTLWEAVGT